MTPDNGNRSEPHRILVVDDDPATAEVLRGMYREPDFRILEARDGRAGLDAARAEAPDVILLDLRMPGMDGLAVAHELKSDSRTLAIPVTFLTACKDPESKTKAFRAGVEGYITKPFNVEELDARIHALLQRSKMLRTLSRDNKALKDGKAQLEQMLVVDEKTGLFNFREFQRKLREEWRRTERYGSPLSLIMMDLDDFKRVNDTRGHPAGDRVLREFAVLVNGGARDTDLAARYGGEEFAVVLPHTSADQAVRVAERIRRAVADFEFLADEQPVRVTVSAGVATYPSLPEIDSPEALVGAADRALYRAKQSGKNAVYAASEEPETEGPADPSGETPRAGAPS